jgi:acetyl-CoA acyltransferase
MKDAVIVDAIRTPVGRSHKEKGWLRTLRPDDMVVHLLKAIFPRNPGIDPGQVEELMIGCANQSGPQGGPGLARICWLMTGYPVHVAANTIEMQCASAMAAIHHSARAIILGDGEIYLAGGVESMSMVPMGSGYEPNNKIAEFFNPYELPMGMTAEKVARKYGISREDMDRFSLESHQKAVKAQEEGKFKDEIIPIEVTYEDGSTQVIDRDQGPRKDTSIEKLAALQPAFLPPDQSAGITAGNSSPLNDGASLVLLMSRDKAKELGYKSALKIISMSHAGVDPTEMGLGPIPATRKALERARLKLDKIDLIEINEAFASQSLYCSRELKFDMSKVNVNGGAIAHGHPLGNSGSRIVVTLFHEMKRRKARYGLATLCVGFGQGAATVMELIDV